MLDWSDIDASLKVKRTLLHGCKCNQCSEGMYVKGHSHPELKWKGSCPVETGDDVSLYSIRSIDGSQVPAVWITITGITRTKKGEFIAHYTVQDGRGRYLAASGQGDQHGYTRSGSKSIDDEAPAVEPEYIEKWTKEIREQEKAREHPKKKERRLRERIKCGLSGLNASQQDELVNEIERLVLKKEEERNAN